MSIGIIAVLALCGVIGYHIGRISYRIWLIFESHLSRLSQPTCHRPKVDIERATASCIKAQRDALLNASHPNGMKCKY